MRRCCNVLFAERSKTSLREPLLRGNTLPVQRGHGGLRVVKEQRVIGCANLAGFGCRWGFARHTMRGFSKSTERKQPCCLTRSSTGSVMR